MHRQGVKKRPKAATAVPAEHGRYTPANIGSLDAGPGTPQTDHAAM